MIHEIYSVNYVFTSRANNDVVLVNEQSFVFQCINIIFCVFIVEILFQNKVIQNILVSLKIQVSALLPDNKIMPPIFFFFNFWQSLLDISGDQ